MFLRTLLHNEYFLFFFFSEDETDCTEDPVFTDLREFDDIRLDCSVKYYGFHAPTMIFKDNTGTNLDAVRVSEDDEIRFYYQVGLHCILQCMYTCIISCS